MVMGAELLVSDPPGADVGHCVPTRAGEGVRALARKLGLSVTLCDVLSRRGLEEPAAVQRFLESRLAHVTAPTHG